MVNEGQAAGASLEHTHAQVYGLGFVPTVVARERERFTAHNTRTMGGCLLCDLLQEEVRRRERVVAIDDEAVLLAPYASRMPYELQLVPRTHERSFAEPGRPAPRCCTTGSTGCASVLGAPPPLNLWVRTAPRGAESFHWHIDVVPRLTQLAGFELGTGVNVNIVAPERAAAELRDEDVERDACGYGVLGELGGLDGSGSPARPAAPASSTPARASRCPAPRRSRRPRRGGTSRPCPPGPR